MCLQFFFYPSHTVTDKKKHFVQWVKTEKWKKIKYRKSHSTIEWDGDEKQKNDYQNVQSSALCAVDQRPRENIILLYIFIIIRSICANVWQHLARGDPGQCAVGLPWSGGVQIKDHAAYHTAGVSAGVYTTIIIIIIIIY